MPDLTARIGLTFSVPLDKPVSRANDAFLDPGRGVFATFSWRCETGPHPTISHCCRCESPAILGAPGAIDMATRVHHGISLACVDTPSLVPVSPRPAPGGALRRRSPPGPSMPRPASLIGLGFSVLLVSAFTPMRTFGGMTAVGLVLAMLCDLFVLSFLLIAFSGTTKGLHHAEDTVAGTGVVHAHSGTSA